MCAGLQTFFSHSFKYWLIIKFKLLPSGGITKIQNKAVKVAFSSFHSAIYGGKIPLKSHPGPRERTKQTLRSSQFPSNLLFGHLQWRASVLMSIIRLLQHRTLQSLHSNGKHAIQKANRCTLAVSAHFQNSLMSRSTAAPHTHGSEPSYSMAQLHIYASRDRIF